MGRIALLKIDDNLFFNEKTSIIVIRLNGKDKSTKLKTSLVLKNGKPQKNKKGHYKVKENLREAQKRRDSFKKKLESPVDYYRDKFENEKILVKDDTFEARFNEVIKKTWDKRSKEQAKLREYYLNLILPFFNESCPVLSMFNYKVWDDLLAWLDEEKPLKGRKKVREHLVYVLRDAAEEGLVRSFHTRKMELPAYEKEINAKDERSLTDKEISKLLNACDKGTYYFEYKKKTQAFKYEGNEKLRLQCEMQLYLGLRPGKEVLGAEFSMFKKDRRLGDIYILPAHLTKNKISRNVPVPDLLWAKVMKLKRSMGKKTKFLFPFVKNIKSRSESIICHEKRQTTNAKNFKRLIKRAGLDSDITPNFLRHTYITHACFYIGKKNGITIASIAKVVGNSTSMIESVYFHLTDDTSEKLRTVFASKKWGKK